MSTPCAPLQVRADLNVPLDKDLNITDDTRIRAAIPTLKYLTDNGAKVLLTSHLVRGAPSGWHFLLRMLRLAVETGSIGAPLSCLPAGPA